MKLLSTIRNRMRKNLVNNKRGQGATEYILLLVVLVGVVMLFKGRIKAALEDKMGNLDEGMKSVTTEL